MTDDCTGCKYYQRGRDNEDDEVLEWEFCQLHSDLIEYIEACNDKEEIR